MPESRGPNDLTDVGALLAIDHQELLQVLTELRRAPATPGVRLQLRRHLVTEILIHLRATGAALYPSIRELLGSDLDGLQQPDHALAAAVDRLVRAPEDQADSELLDDLERPLSQHQRTEETEIVPRLTAALGGRGMGTLASAYSDAKEAYSGLTVPLSPPVSRTTTETPTAES
jgi:hypothetical protein